VRRFDNWAVDCACLRKSLKERLPKYSQTDNVHVALRDLNLWSSSEAFAAPTHLKTIVLTAIFP
jgi:hypothetical protein